MKEEQTFSHVQRCVQQMLTSPGGEVLFLGETISPEEVVERDGLMPLLLSHVHSLSKLTQLSAFDWINKFSIETNENALIGYEVIDNGKPLSGTNTYIALLSIYDAIALANALTPTDNCIDLSYLIPDFSPEKAASSDGTIFYRKDDGAYANKKGSICFDDFESLKLFTEVTALSTPSMDNELLSIISASSWTNDIQQQLKARS